MTTHRAASRREVLHPPLPTSDLPHATGLVGSTDLRRGTAVLAVAGIVIGLANYGGALVMTHLVSAHEFSRYAAGQSLLLVLGTGSMAALPWAVSRFLVGSEYSRSRPEAMHFALRASAVQGVGLGLLALLGGWVVGGAAFGATVGLSAFSISLIAGPVGFFQGEARLGVVATMRVLETGVRIATGFVLVLLVSRSASAGLLGFAAGAVIAFGFALTRARHAFPLRRLDSTVTRRLSRQAMLLGTVQVLLAMLGALDTVYIAVAHVSAADAASYQAAALIGRIPLFVSAALCTAIYPSMVRADSEAEVGLTLRTGARQFGWLMVPFVIACVSVPHDLLYRLIPAQYTQTQSVLRITCILGVLIGAINVLTTAHQARAFYRRPIAILGVAAVIQGAVLVGSGLVAGITAFASAGVVVIGACFLALVLDARRWLVGATVTASWPVALATALAVATVAAPLDDTIWVACVGVLGLLSLSRAFGRGGTWPTVAPPPSRHAGVDS